MTNIVLYDYALAAEKLYVALVFLGILSPEFSTVHFFDLVMFRRFILLNPMLCYLILFCPAAIMVPHGSPFYHFWCLFFISFPILFSTDGDPEVRRFTRSPFDPSIILCDLLCDIGLNYFAYKRHGYSWVPTDQGSRGPCQVDPTCQKPRPPASGPGDIIHNPEDLRRPHPDSGRPVRLVA
jgi:hypothetical protein